MGNLPIDKNPIRNIIQICTSIISIICILMGLMILILFIKPAQWPFQNYVENQSASAPTKDITSSLLASTAEIWIAPDTSSIASETNADEIQYGRQLIANTSNFLGPKGLVMPISNGMNCQNCHLNAGTKPFGNNYSAVASTYPKFRPRSGTEESIEKRVNDCLERSLNGKLLPNESREMKAIVAYIKWVGKNVPKDSIPKGSGLLALTYLDRPANPEKGKFLYALKCTVCHSKNGEGIMNPDGTAWVYPPLWGKNSYNVGAGLYRLSRFAGYIKANMPLGATFNEPQLTDEEAWDLAAYINSMARPQKDLSMDWPDISKKPIDHPFGPFTDGFNEAQHKFGPFKPIAAKRKEFDKLKK